MSIQQAVNKLGEFASLQTETEYFKGMIGTNPLPVPVNILLFVRFFNDKIQLNRLQSSRGFHPRFVLLFNHLGKGHVHLDHLELMLSPGQALLIHPHQLHYYSHIAPPPLQWIFCTFNIDPAETMNSLRNQAITLRERSLQAFEDLMNIWMDPPSGLQASLMQSSLLRFLVLMKEDQQDIPETDLQPELPDNLMRRINRRLSEQRDASVSSLAQELHLSESRLRTHFKEISGLSLSKYIRLYRIHRAMTLLRTTEFSIASVAEEAGFGSPQAFCATFKQNMGQSPGNYRRETKSV